MSDSLGTSIVTVLLALIGVAVIAILISPKAQTGKVLTAGGGAFSGILATALAPVTGTSASDIASLFGGGSLLG